ncbi:MAG: regulatory iron-sulfur-containing complex subunit RicT [Flavobacteriales bacterium]|nr:regulatory iron-sulfur-containing complex subunit RicT [Flavobacteriales bacterium]
MGCGSCGTNSNGLPTGCKNNGVCGNYGCSKLDVFDWLTGTALPDGQKTFDVVEVRFKSTRKGFFRNSSALELHAGDVVAVESSPGHDVGVISLTGELVRMQMKRKEVKDDYQIRKIYRKARQEDIERWQEARKNEPTTLVRAKEISKALRLDMKLSDVEYQGDHSKATFFYSADDRVDFRELIRKYAEEFRVKIEMRQIGLRVEAGRIGGIGVCGRELCCSTWLTDFRSVSTAAARYQQLSLNPAKLAGQCGKLKCCLNYELDQYLEAMRDFPSNTVRLQLAKGIATHVKTDIFQRMMYYAVEGHDADAPIGLPIESVREIMEMNKRGERPGDMEEFMKEEVVVEKEILFANVVGQDSLNRFDHKKGRSRDRGRGRSDRERSRGGAENKSDNRPRQQRPERKPGKGPGEKPTPQGQQPRPQRALQPPRPDGDKRPQGNQPRGNRNRPNRGGGGKPPQNPNPQPPKTP